MLIPMLIIIILGINIKIIFAVFALTFFSLLAINFYILRILVVLAIFFFFKIIALQVSVLLVFPLMVAFVISFKNIDFPKIKNPVGKYFILYFLLTLPSLFNATVPLLNTIQLMNLIAFFLFINVIYYSTNNLKDLYKLLGIFLFFLVIDSLYIFWLGLSSGDRVFGYTKVYFVDLAGIGIIISLLMFLIKENQKYIHGIASASITIALLLTQTRNTWIVVVLTLLISLFYLYRNAHSISISKRKLLAFLFGAAILVIAMVVILKGYSSGIEDRVTDLSSTDTQSSNSRIYLPSNSIVSRFFIWDTAILGFLKHPFIGIGVYGFPYQSKEYYEIPEYLFDIYVKGLDPHHGYLGVLVETGLIGFSGLILFLISVIRNAYQNIKLSRSKDEISLSIVLFFSFVYIVISLNFTHAWFWGQNMMLFSLLIGLSTAHHKILSSK